MEESNERKMKRAKESEWGRQLPRDVIFEILARVPRKSVIKLKTICKLWFNIMSNPNFAKFHLEQCLSKLMFIIFKNGAHQFFSFNLTEMSIKVKKLACLQIKLLLYDYWFGNGNESYYFFPHASCDGLVLFTGEPNDNYRRIQILVCDSISHRFKLLPPLPNLGWTGQFSGRYLLVHDASIQKYKVVVLCLGDDDSLKRCCILTLDDDDDDQNGINEGWWVLWKPPYPQRSIDIFSSVTLNGVLHWTARKITQNNNYNGEVAFVQRLNIEREEFVGIIELPWKQLFSRRDYSRISCTLLAIKGSLCLMNPASNGELDIWVLKKYWIKQHKIPLSSMPCPALLTGNAYCVFKPVFVMESCHFCMTYIFIWHCYKLFCYNVERQEIRQIGIEGEVDSFVSRFPCIVGR